MLTGAPIGIFILSLVVDKLPRKKSLVRILIFLSLVTYIYSIQKDVTVIVALGFFLNVAIYFYIALSAVVYVPEIFPTEARLRGLGFGNAIGWSLILVC